MRIALPPTISPAAFAARDPAAAVSDLSGETMGTTWSVRYAAPASVSAAAIRDAVVGRLAGLVAEMSHWEPSSLLSRFNRSRAGTWRPLPPDFAHVIARGLAIARQTQGAFDPTIGALVDLWGFGPVPRAEPPTEAALDAAHAASGWHRLAFEPNGAHLCQPGGLSLDLSGIAKGHAVDAIADLLRGHGITDCLVEIGGELVGRGIRPDGDPWWVDLESPPDLALPPLRIALHGIAVATSGDYRRGAHTIDPRSGRPIDSGIVSVSVIHDTALEADAWATALTVLGVQNGLALAEEKGVAARLVVARDGVATEYLTPALEAMLAD